MANPIDEQYLLSEVPKRLRTKTHINTVMRWALKGVGTPKVRLGTTKVGGRRFTDDARLRLFLAALNGGVPPGQVHAVDAAPRGRDAAELDADGFV